MSLAILCSGQGGQDPAMFDVVERDAAAASLIGRADEWAGFDLVATVRASSTIFENAVAQPLICAFQGIVWSLLAERLAAVDVVPALVAGYSVGELAGHGCAGRLSWADTVALARRRAAVMDAAGGADDSLIALRGPTRAVVDAMAARHGVFVAIVNGDDQTIVGGRRAALDALAAEATGRGATVQRLPVGIAAHTPRLAAAVAPFREALRSATWNDAGLPVLAGVDGSIVRDRDAAVDALSRQLAETIRWDACMDALVERGVATCLELGPGNALSRLMRDRHRGVDARAVADFRGLDAVVAWVARSDR